MAHKWAAWLHNPYCLGGSKHFRLGEKIGSVPISGQIDYMALAVLAVPNASKWGPKSAVAHKWACWLHNPYHLGGPQCSTPGDNINSGPQVGKLATQTVLFGGCPNLQIGGQNEQWPTNGQIGYITPAI